MIKEISHVVAYLFMALGVFFSLTSVLGILRFPDVYTRIHAGTKALTGGALFVLTGGAILAPSWQASAKFALIIVFFLITNPLSSHAVARACYRHGIKPELIYKDEYRQKLSDKKG